MKKTYLIPLLVLLLLIVAGIFRWDVGVTQTFDKSLKIQNLKDRWTGQNWVEINGSIPERARKEWSYNWVFYHERDYWVYGWGSTSKDNDSAWENILHGINIKPDDSTYYIGELYPYFSNTLVKSKAKEVQKSKVGTNKINELNLELANAEKDKQANSKGHEEYLALYESLKNNQELTKDQYNKGLLYGMDKTAYKLGIPVANSSKVIRPLIPTNIVTEYDQWREAYRHIRKIEYQLDNVDYWNKSIALKQLTQEANNERNILTITWVALMLLSLIASIFMLMSSAKKKSEINQDIT